MIDHNLISIIPFEHFKRIPKYGRKERKEEEKILKFYKINKR